MIYTKLPKTASPPVTCHRFSSSASAILTSPMMKLNDNIRLNAKSVRFTQPRQRLTLGPLFLDGISKGTHNMRLMELRAHPLMTCSGLPNWPPVWMWTDGNVNKNPKGEVGTLVEVQVCQSQRANRFFLVIEYEDSQYMGCLQFDDPSFRRRVCDLLGKYCGHSIEEIGSLDLSISIAGLEISMTALKALAILEAAVLECKKRNINKARDALNFLGPHTKCR